ncbi:hypothetical protein ACUTQ5_13710 [Serratia sp. NA_112.1]|uniref:hypothetical protein n=1 Tax=unclassified Serratia (in: enterobacteria) TaxID=2647522 RepID=UPI004046F22C
MIYHLNKLAPKIKPSTIKAPARNIKTTGIITLPPLNETIIAKQKQFENIKNEIKKNKRHNSFPILILQLSRPLISKKKINQNKKPLK